jgi:single-strand DNA-binding protein
MISLDEVRIQGNLARDPQVLPSSGKARTRIVVAVNYGYGDSQKTQYRDVMLFGTTAENAAKYLTKGSEVHVDGHHNTNVYDPGNGADKVYTLEIIGDRVQFGRKPNSQTQTPAEELAAA